MKYRDNASYASDKENLNLLRSKIMHEAALILQNIDEGDPIVKELFDWEETFYDSYKNLKKSRKALQ